MSTSRKKKLNGRLSISSLLTLGNHIFDLWGSVIHTVKNKTGVPGIICQELWLKKKSVIKNYLEIRCVNKQFLYYQDFLNAKWTENIHWLTQLKIPNEGGSSYSNDLTGRSNLFLSHCCLPAHIHPLHVLPPCSYRHALYQLSNSWKGKKKVCLIVVSAKVEKLNLSGKGVQKDFK